jgi:hypothetical protein
MSTLKEALAELKSRVKPYNSVSPVMYQGTFSNTIKAIEWGFAKPKTIECFMNKFGYQKDGENWNLIKVITSMSLDECSILPNGEIGISASNIKYQ